MKKWNALLFFVLWKCAFGQESSITETKEVVSNQSPQSKFFENAGGSVEELLKMRDPFKRKKIRAKKTSESKGFFLKNNSYSNLPVLGKVPLEQIRITGIFLGKHRRAIARIAQGDTLGKNTYILKEGMKLGEHESEIKAILPGGVVLAEKIVNVYGQEEYIETVLPMSN